MKRLVSSLVLLLTGVLISGAAPAPLTVGWSTLKTLTSNQVSSPARDLNNKVVSVRALWFRWKTTPIR